METKSKFEHEQIILEGIRRAFEKTKHHQLFTGRVTNVIRAELPEYTVSDFSYTGLQNLRVWGNGLNYDESIYLCWSAHTPWQQGLEKELKRQDTSDYRERLRAELRILDEFEYLNQEVLNAKNQAQQLIESLPIPQASIDKKFRDKTWDRPSAELRAKFPALFD